MGDSSSAVYNIKGDAEKQKSLNIHATPDQAKLQLEAALGHYKEGFKKNFDYFCGINAMRTSLGLGNKKEAQDIAELVFLSAVRDGGYRTKNFNKAVAMLESGLVAGVSKEEMDKTITTLQECNHTRDQLQEVITRLETVIDPAIQGLRDDNQYRQLIQTTITDLNNLLQGNKKMVVREPDELINDMIWRKTFNYRNINENEIVTGNFRNGGIIADHSVTSRDKDEFNKLLFVPIENIISALGGNPDELLDKDLAKNARLIDIKDPKIVLPNIHKIVRTNFATKEKSLEIIDGKDHHFLYDDEIQAYNGLSGIKDPRYEVDEDKKRKQDH